ncbi:MAG: hypothetical protein JXK05_06640 [Campylobacterales bacterium]|nr:hypothetical protein [Campylobacterales bacterium]
MRFSIDEYAQRFKMSKEMIHFRMRNKRLNYIIEDGNTYIIVPRSALEPQEAPKSTPTPQTPPNTPKKTTVAAIIALYQKENRHLKERIKILEAKIDKLIDDKERMLIDERRRIEQLYAHKDEQLKSILELLNTKMLTSQSAETVHDVGIEEPMDTFGRLVELKRYLKSLEYSSEERKQIKRRFALAYGNDIRVIQQNGEFFLDFSKYDYSDLLNT